jgi:hypothetical protein
MILPCLRGGGGERVEPEGALPAFQFIPNIPHNPITDIMRVRHYIGRRYSHGFDPSFRKPLIVQDIALRMVIALVYLTIKFNDKLGFCTIKSAINGPIGCCLRKEKPSRECPFNPSHNRTSA